MSLLSLQTMAARLLEAHSRQMGIVESEPLRICRLVAEHQAYSVVKIPDGYILTIVGEYKRLGPWKEDEGEGVDIDRAHGVRPINSCKGILDNCPSPQPSPAGRGGESEPIHIPAFLRVPP